MYDFVTIGDVFEDAFLKPNESSFYDAQIRLSGKNLCLRHGDKISVEEIHFDLGGSACNVAAGLNKLGLKTTILSAIGNDERGQRIRNKLTISNIDIKYIKQFANMSTNFSAIIVYKGERTVLLYRGLKDYSKLVIPKKLATRWIYLGPVAEEFSQNYPSLITLAAEKNISIAINPGHRQIMKGRTKLKNLIRVAKVLILNKQEALDLTQLSPVTSEKKLLTMLKTYGVEVICLTDGKNGAYAADGESYIGGKIFPTDSIDPTGAGDAFSSGFLASFIKGSNINNAVKWGIINSGLVTEKFGAQKNLQSEGQIKKLLSKLPELYKL